MYTEHKYTTTEAAKIEGTKLYRFKHRHYFNGGAIIAFSRSASEKKAFSELVFKKHEFDEEFLFFILKNGNTIEGMDAFEARSGSYYFYGFRYRNGNKYDEHSGLPYAHLSAMVKNMEEVLDGVFEEDGTDSYENTEFSSMVEEKNFLHQLCKIGGIEALEAIRGKCPSRFFAAYYRAAKENVIDGVLYIPTAHDIFSIYRKMSCPEYLYKYSDLSPAYTVWIR